MGIFYYCSKCGKRTDNENNNKLCTACEATDLDFYFYVWCEQLGFYQKDPWKVQQIVAQTKRIAALLFIDWYDERNPYAYKSAFGHHRLADIITKNLIIHVQDWRGVVTKFEIEEIKTKYNYILRKI